MNIHRKKSRECSRNNGFSVLRIILFIILILAAAFVACLILFTAREYRPAKKESVTPEGGSGTVSQGDSISILTYNTGYSGLGAAEDFFMDGGSTSMPSDKETVEGYLSGNADLLKEEDADIYLLQEVDKDSRRSYHIDQEDYYESALGLKGMYAYNYKCFFVPYPVRHMMGKINSGILTMTDYQVKSAERVSLPVAFSWPIRTCNLKRCLLISRIPVEGSDKELVIINLHLEAYDKGQGKIRQTQLLSSILTEEYAKGNYVIAGGDFNQTFEGIKEYPIQDPSYWTPGHLSESDLPEHFSLVVADNDSTSRLNNKPYDAETAQEYIIDGFIVSDNVQVDSVHVEETEYEYADHRPVKLVVTIP